MAAKKPETLPQFCDRLSMTVALFRDMSPATGVHGYGDRPVKYRIVLDRDGADGPVEIPWYTKEEGDPKVITVYRVMESLREECFFARDLTRMSSMEAQVAKVRAVFGLDETVVASVIQHAMNDAYAIETKMRKWLADEFTTMMETVD